MLTVLTSLFVIFFGLSVFLTVSPARVTETIVDTNPGGLCYGPNIGSDGPVPDAYMTYAQYVFHYHALHNTVVDSRLDSCSVMSSDAVHKNTPLDMYIATSLLGLAMVYTWVSGKKHHE